MNHIPAEPLMQTKEPIKPGAPSEIHACEFRNQGQAECDTIRVLNEQLQASEDRHLRLLAEFDNYRKRSERMAQEDAYNKIRGIFLDLLAVGDSFERAQTGLLDNASQTVRDGVAAMATQFREVLRRYGVSQIDGKGTRFDPNWHEVLDCCTTPDEPPMTITCVYRTGYRMDGKLLRPSLVQVASDDSGAMVLEKTGGE